MDFIIPAHVFSSSPQTRDHIPRSRLRSNSGQEAFSSILNFENKKINTISQQNQQRKQQQDVRRLNRRRANTTNSLFSLRSTMETTPISITLACIAHVVFKHLADSATWLRERPTARRLPKKWSVFNDSTRTVSKERKGGVSVFRGNSSSNINNNGGGRDSGSSFSSTDERGQSFDFDFEEVPEESEILSFFKTVYDTAQLEMDTLVTSLVYIERLLGVGGRRGMLITARNWRTIVFTSLVLASKMMDDWTMWSSDFAKILGCSPQRLNELEMKFLEALSYDVNLKSSDYARYHFTLRSLAYHLSLEGDEIGVDRLNKPLKFATAKNMSGLSQRLEDNQNQKKSNNLNNSTRPNTPNTIGLSTTRNNGGSGNANNGTKNNNQQSSFSISSTNSSSQQKTPSLSLSVMRARGSIPLRERSESAFHSKDVEDQSAPELNLPYKDMLKLQKGRERKISTLKRKTSTETTFLSIDELLLSRGGN